MEKLINDINALEEGSLPGDSGPYTSSIKKRLSNSLANAGKSGFEKIKKTLSPVGDTIHTGVDNVKSSIKKSVSDVEDSFIKQTGTPGKFALGATKIAYKVGKKLAPGVAVSVGAHEYLIDDDAKKAYKEGQTKAYKNVDDNVVKILNQKEQLQKDRQKLDSDRRTLDDKLEQQRQKDEMNRKIQEKQQQIDQKKIKDGETASKETNKSTLVGSLTSKDIMKKLDDHKYALGATGLAALGGLGYAAYKKIKKDRAKKGKI